MSVLHWGDENMHYSDGSHRWIAPDGTDQTVWEAGVHAHLAQHLATMGGPVRHDPQRGLWSRRNARSRDQAPPRTLRLIQGDADSGQGRSPAA